MNEKDFAELSAGHALNALTPEDERAYRDALAAHPEWADLANADVQTAAFLAEGFGEETPPESVRENLLARLGTTPQFTMDAADAAPAPVPAVVPDAADTPVAGGVPDAADSVTPAEAPDAAAPPLPPVPAAEAAAAEPAAPTAPPTEVVQTIQRKNWTRGLFALVASAALLVGIGWGVGSIVERARTPVEVLALEEIEAAPDAETVVGQFEDGNEATVHWSDTVGKVVFTVDETPEIADDRTFELWIIRDETPVAAGTFEPGQDITALLDGTVEPGDVIAVTVEADGGSPDGSPTTDPIIAISTNPGDET
ncbi:anti-sigma factor domain-containing protein [Microbacterium sp.]|uniref:anti-sigma factor n=1 Tax=Microbacterium sp. TaxID=51671 RepID=UPI0037369CD0